MSIFGDFRAAVPELFDAFELPALLVTRAQNAQVMSNADRAAGRKPPKNVLTFTGRGMIAPRTTKLADGTIKQDTVATTDVELIKGDTLTIGTRTLEVIEVIDFSPDGLSPLMFKAVVK